MSTAIDWAAKPRPWCWIGPSFAAEVHAICGRVSAPKPEKLPDLAGTELQARMLRAKIHASELARRAGCHRSTINGLIYGRISASHELWARINAVLGAP